MDDVTSYIRQGHKIKHHHFRRGFASVVDKPPLPPGAEAVAMAGAVLPLKRSKRKRGRSTSSDEVAPEARPREQQQPQPQPQPQAADTAPSSTADGRPRVSLMSKWFPGNTLKQATIAPCHAPPAASVAATVHRVTAAREYMILLRAGLEDLEAVVDEVSASIAGSSAPNGLCHNADVRRLVTTKTAPGVGEALAQFAKEGGHEVSFVRRQLRRVMRRKGQRHGPRVLSIKRWHEFVNKYGPEAGVPPTMTEFVWMSNPNTTLLFTVLVQRFLRAVKQATKVAVGQRVDVHASNDGVIPAADETEGEESQDILDINSANDGFPENDGAAPLNNGNDGCGAYAGCDLCWLQVSQSVLNTVEHRLTEAQCQLLVFLRFLMPVSEASSPQRWSCGYGVWLLACLVALDVPLDPDTSCLAHDLFRTCCDQVRVIGEWTGVSGDDRGALLDYWQRCESAERVKEGANTRAYTSFADVGRTELLALYTIIIVLAKVFRQNQNRLIPL